MQSLGALQRHFCDSHLLRSYLLRMDDLLTQTSESDKKHILAQHQIFVVDPQLSYLPCPTRETLPRTNVLKG